MEKYPNDMKTRDPQQADSSDNLESGHPELGVVQHDAVFGEVTDEGPNYRSVSSPDPDLSASC